MPRKRVADIARERGLDPGEVARRLAEAGVRLQGDTVDEAAAARALGGGRSNRAARPAAGDARAGRRAGASRGPCRRRSASRSRGSGRRAPGRAATRGRRRRDRPAAGNGAGANPPGGSRVARPQRGPQLGGRRRVVIDTAASRPQRDTRQRGRRGRGEHRPERREEVPAPTGPATVRSGVTVKDLAAALGISTAADPEDHDGPRRARRHHADAHERGRRDDRRRARARDHDHERRRRGRRPRRRSTTRPRISSRAPRSSRSWATSTTARRACWTRSARRASSRARPAASRSTSAPTRRSSATTAAPSRSSTPRATRRSPPCAPAPAA